MVLQIPNDFIWILTNVLTVYLQSEQYALQDYKPFMNDLDNELL